MIGGVRMCDFCKNIYKSDYGNTDYKDYIYKSEDGIFIHFTTGDSFIDFDYKINYCPIVEESWWKNETSKRIAHL